MFLDLRNRFAVLDFLVDTVEYFPDNHPMRLRVALIVQDDSDGTPVSREALAEMARDIGKTSWSARVLLRRYLHTPEGAEEEWRRVLSAVSTSTSHLLARFRQGVDGKSLEDVLDHEESWMAFREQERLEISEVRKHILPLIWKENQKRFAVHIGPLESRLAEIVEQINELRELGFSTTTVDDGEVVAKIARYEDRMYYEGQEINPEVIEEELAYYRQQKALADVVDKEIPESGTSVEVLSNGEEVDGEDVDGDV